MSPYIPTVTVLRRKTRVRLWLAASASTIEKNAIAEAKTNKSLWWWDLDCDNKLSPNGRTFRLYVNYWILSRTEHAQLGFVAHFALQRLTFHLTLLTFDKSDLVGTDGLNTSPACFVTDVSARSWIQNVGEVSNLRKRFRMEKPFDLWKTPKPTLSKFGILRMNMI